MEIFSTLVSIQILLVTITISAVASGHAQYFQKILRQMAIFDNGRVGYGYAQYLEHCNATDHNHDVFRMIDYCSRFALTTEK